MENNSLFLEASMSDSFIYGLFNSSGEIQTRIMKALKEGIVLNRSHIEEQILQIQRTRLSPLASKVLEAFDDGVVRLVYWNTLSQGMTKSIPFVLHKSANGPVASIFISSFGKLANDDTQLDIPMKNLYILMESAFLALNFQTRPMVMRRNTSVMKITNDIYVEMYMRLLNREYALSLDPSLHDKISAAISRFFLENVWELENKSIVVSYANQTTTGKSSAVLDPMHMEYDSKDIHTLEDLFKFLKEISPRMQSLTVKYFVERWINTFGGPSILAMDYLPYVIFVIVNTLLGGFLVSQTTLSDIVKNTKEIRKFWPEIIKLV